MGPINSLLRSLILMAVSFGRPVYSDTLHFEQALQQALDNNKNLAASMHSIESARSEALNAFSDDRLLVEKYLPKAHHIEFQIFGDKHGHITHLFERECSVQRRHQKVIEESPSPLLTPELRKKMGSAAEAVARSVNYFSAGTVEFIVNPDTLDFYFLEMNTRLQVEHPVTEMVLGIDLAQWQIRVAAGEVFPYSHETLHQRGHAIEARLYAEDPENNFLPSTGVIYQFADPSGPGIRLDSGIAVGSEVSHFYDPMLAKIIVRAEDRATAIQRLQSALRHTVVHGVVTNIGLLQNVLAHDDFQAGIVTTRWVEEMLGELQASPNLAFEAIVAASLADFILPAASSAGCPPESSSPDPFSPWKSANGFRLRKSA